VGESKFFPTFLQIQISHKYQVYDTDGNILQAIDDTLIPSLISQAFTLFSPSAPITVTELGCGTGRNTIKLLSQPQSSSIEVSEINALDLSPAMLELAQSRCSNFSAPKIQFHSFNAIQPDKFPSVQQLQRKADLVLSTLVLEHLPLPVFFQTVKKFLQDLQPRVGLKP